jgi:hypothetical protein
MSRMKTLCTALFAVFALAAAFTASQAAATEFVLPDVHVLSGETYPASATGSVENAGAVVAELETEIGERLTATKVTASAELTGLSSLGPGTLKFNGVKEVKSNTACNGKEGEKKQAEGEVTFTGEYHVVVTSTALTGPAILILFPELTVECNAGKTKIKVKAPALIKLTLVTSGTDVESYGIVANCTAKGKQELKEYVNDTGTFTKGSLTANFGLGFESACERATNPAVAGKNAEKELILKSNKMIDFLF